MKKMIHIRLLWENLRQNHGSWRYTILPIRFVDVIHCPCCPRSL